MWLYVCNQHFVLDNFCFMELSEILFRRRVWTCVTVLTPTCWCTSRRASRASSWELQVTQTEDDILQHLSLCNIITFGLTLFWSILNTPPPLGSIVNEDIPPNLTTFFEQEKAEEALRRKEKQEAHLYMTVEVIQLICFKFPKGSLT